MSSHREAPAISKDPVADSADLYAFTSPDAPDTVTIIANYVPLEGPAGGPNFYEFGNDVLYSIWIDNDADSQPEIAINFRFVNHIKNPNTFLYNFGPIDSLASPNWNRTQTYQVTWVQNGQTTVLGSGPDLPAREHRAALHPELRGARPGGGPQPAGRDQGLRRPAA